MKRKATAVWNGSIKEGEGFLTTATKVLNNTAYSFNSRFAEGTGTNPEELIAAAHAGCFSMKLSGVLTEAGQAPESIETECTVSIDNFVIGSSHLVVKVKAPGLDAEKFQEYAKDAKENCPVSQALKMEITMDAQLVS